MSITANSAIGPKPDPEQAAETTNEQLYVPPSEPEPCDLTAKLTWKTLWRPRLPEKETQGSGKTGTAEEIAAKKSSKKGRQKSCEKSSKKSARKTNHQPDGRQ